MSLPTLAVGVGGVSTSVVLIRLPLERAPPCRALVACQLSSNLSAQVNNLSKVSTELEGTPSTFCLSPLFKPDR